MSIFNLGKKRIDPTKTMGTITDIDGNVYKTVKIGNQIWLAENLKVTRYRSGDVIPNVTDSIKWGKLTIGARCAYENNESHVETYGYLYNWYAVNDNRNIAPDGWHVPMDEEWKEMEMYLGMKRFWIDREMNRGKDEGGKLKEVGVVHWKTPNTGATNISGFSALPGGFYNPITGDFRNIGLSADFWSSSDNILFTAWYRVLNFEDSVIWRYYRTQRDGNSVRCVKD